MIDKDEPLSNSEISSHIEAIWHIMKGYDMLFKQLVQFMIHHHSLDAQVFAKSLDRACDTLLQVGVHPVSCAQLSRMADLLLDRESADKSEQQLEQLIARLMNRKS